MKKDIIIYSLILTFLPFFSRGQLVSDRTNQIQLDFGAPEINTSLPEIIWEYPKLQYTNSKESRLTLRAEVTSHVPLKSVKLVMKKSLDDEAMGTREIPVDSTTYRVKVDQSLRLPDGQNFLQLIVENTEGGMVQDYRSVIIGMDAITDAVAIDRKDYALLFATNKYNNWSDLTNPIFDSETIGKELREKYNFQVEIVKDANQDIMMNKLREYAQKSYKPQDQLLIFFAGHGQYDETFGEGYIVAKNSLANDPGKNSYISYNRIRSIINNIPSSHIFLTMDVCFGGTFDEALAAQRALYDEIDNAEFIVKKLSMTTRKYLTSGSKEYVPDGVAGHHSPFAKKFIEALRSNGGEDRILTLTEINVYMEKLQTTPRFGGFGIDEHGSEFLFITQ